MYQCGNVEQNIHCKNSGGSEAPLIAKILCKDQLTDKAPSNNTR